MSRHFVRRNRWLVALSSCALLAALWQGDAFDGLIAGDSNEGSTSSGSGLPHFGFGHKSAAAAAVPPAYSLTQMWAATPTSAVAIARGDFNGDGRDDLAAVGGDLTDLSSLVELSLYLQQPNGVLGAAVTHALPMDVEHFKVLGLEATDLNEDGRSDLVITIRDNSGMHYLLSQPGGVFAWQVDTWSVLVPSAKAQVADMDGDGHADIFVPLIDPDANPFSGDAGMLATFFSDGHGNFLRHGFELTAEITRNFALGQLNADSLPDFLSLRDEPYEQRTFLRRSEGGGAFSDAQVLDARWPEEFWEVTAADIHGGAHADTVALARSGIGFPRFVVYPQLANGELATQPVQYAAGDYSSHLRHADLDGDGDEDLLQAGQDRAKAQFFYYLQDEYGLGYPRAVLFDLSGSSDQYEMRDMTTGDFNSDGVTDVAVGTMSHGVMVAKGVLTPNTGAGVLPGPPAIGQLTPDPWADNLFRSVSVSVTAPVDNGGNPITGYTVYSIPGGGIDKDAGSNAAVHEMVGLDNNHSYTFYARASTVAGMGMASALSAPLVLGTPPDPGGLPVVRGEAASYGNEPDVGVRNLRILVGIDRLAPVGGVSVSLTTVDGTAVAGSDYVATGPLSVTVPEGQSYVFVDILMIVGDMVPEETEKFSFHLSNPQGATILTPDFEVTVFDNDIDDSPRIVIGSVDLAEGDSGTHVINVPIILNKAQPADVIFDVEDASVSYGTVAGVDFVPFHFVGVKIPAGQTSTTVPITINGDLEYELDEFVAPYLTNIQGATEGQSAFASIIQNDDAPPEIYIADASVLEGNSVGGIAKFTVSISEKMYQDAHFTIASIAGSAKAGSDFKPYYLTGLFIPKGETSVQVEIPVLADDLYELDDTFAVTLQDTDGLPIADGVAVGTIVNDDAPPVFTVSDVNVAEGGNAHFTVSLSKVIGMDAMFDLWTGPGTAQPDIDYSAPGFQGVIIPEGTTTRTLDVATMADTVVEMDETFVVNATHIVGAGPVVHVQGRGTIVNDDLAMISIADATFVEGNAGTGTAVFQIRLSAPMSTPVTLSVGTVAGGSAQEGVDYSSLAPALRTIDAGRTRIVFNVPVIGDTSVEANETFLVKVTGVSGAGVADDTATGTILNDDSAAFPGAVQRARNAGRVPGRIP